MPNGVEAFSVLPCLISSSINAILEKALSHVTHLTLTNIICGPHESRHKIFRHDFFCEMTVYRTKLSFSFDFSFLELYWDSIYIVVPPKKYWLISDNHVNQNE